MHKSKFQVVIDVNGVPIRLVVEADDWSDIPCVLNDANIGHNEFEIVEYLDTPRDFIERYPQLMTDRIRRNEDFKHRMRKLYSTIVLNK